MLRINLFTPGLMRYLIMLMVLVCGLSAFSQTTEIDVIAANEKFRKELNEEYASEEKSPLAKEDRLSFKELPFFDIKPEYRVEAKFTRNAKPKPFKMKTTTDRKPLYEVFGVATFTLNGQAFKLNVYQSQQLREMEEFKDYLFLPFTDLSNSDCSYGGGRFIDLKIPEGDQLVIDFNQAYNPYCAYNHKYSCPIPPKENFLNTKVLAGVKTPTN